MEGCLRKQLELLNCEYVDLFLIHWPVAFKLDEAGKQVKDKIPLAETWKEMEEMVRLGLARSIGVSNFNV